MATQVTLNSGSVDSAGSLALKTNGTTTAVTINASQGVEFNAGTAAAPSITTTGDTNTGIFFPAADTIAFAEGGVESARIDSAGNFGLGVTPSAWSGTFKVFQNSTGSFYGTTTTNGVVVNGYNGAGWKFIANGYAPRYEQLSNDGGHYWATSNNNTSGAGATITYNSSAMVLDASANLKVYNDVYVNGTAKLSRNPLVQANSTSNQTFSAGTTTKVLFQNASVDTNTCFSSSTFTPNVAGYYLIYAQISPQANTSQEITPQLQKNGSSITRLARQSGNASYTTYFGGTSLVYLNGSTDYVEIYLFTQGTFTSEATFSTFSSTFVRNA